MDNSERMTKWYQDNHLRVNCDTTTPDSYDTLLKRAKVTILQNRGLQDILILMFKVKIN